MAEVLYTDEFKAWWDSLSAAQQDDVAGVVGLLAAEGVALRFPHCSAIRGSRIALREMRIKSRGRPFRVFYVFDPERQVVLLIGGDKTGKARFYEVMIPLAERIYAEYLKETGQSEEG